MNIKKIIREELEAVLDSFYLLVSEDENFIYTRGHLGGYRWESVNGLDPKEIMNSGFKEYSEPEGMISRMKREEISRGEETPNYLKPKIVPVDFILRKRDESFPMMESNDMEWINDINPIPEIKIGTCFVDEMSGVLKGGKWIIKSIREKPSVTIIEVVNSKGKSVTLNKKYFEEDLINGRYKGCTESIKESDELDWIKDIQPFSSGEHFNEDSICFREYSTNSMLGNCEVVIDDKSINFTVSTEKFAEYFWKGGPYHSWEDESWILEPLMSMGTPYDGHGDYYEIESEEFEYSYNYLSDSDRERFSDIINTINGTEVDFNLFDNNMLSIVEYLKYDPLSVLFETLIDDYVNHIGYAIQKNRWLNVSSVWDERVERSRAEWGMQGDQITISIPLIEAEKLYGGTGVTNLSDLLKKIVSPVSEIDWHDWFNDDWDPDGAESHVDESFDDFLSGAESYLESEIFERDKVDYQTIFDLGFALVNRNSLNYYKKMNEDGTFWLLWIFSGLTENTITLKLFNRDTVSFYNTKPVEQHSDLPFVSILDYVKP